MLSIDKRCPWCGRGISAPGRLRGVCENCRKPYRPIVLLYNRTNTSRSEMAVWVWYAMQFVVLALLARSLTVFYHNRHGVSLFSLVLMVILTAGFVLGKKQAYLKRIVSEEERLHPQECFMLVRRRVYLQQVFPSPLYHSPFDMEILDPDTGAAYPRHAVQIDLDENLKPVMETAPEVPEYLQKPGMAFRLYRKNGEMLTEGITSILCSQPLQVFQVQLELPAGAGTLDKKRYYIASVHLDEGEVPFYLVPDAHDLLGDMKTGQTVYEVQLIHRSYPLQNLPIPARFELLQADGKRMGGGTVTYYFANRGLFEQKSS